MDIIPDRFDLSQAQQDEAQRLLKVLGEYASTDFDRIPLRNFARERLIPVHCLTRWKHDYLLHGLDGLLPRDWKPLSDKDKELVQKRLEQLGNLTSAITITSEDIASLEARLNSSPDTAIRLIRRYQIGGLWGLARQGNPARRRSPVAPQPALAIYDIDTIIDEIERKREILGKKLLEKIDDGATISDQEVIARAKEVRKSKSLLWSYIQALRQYKSAGLAPRTRADKGQHHNISERMIMIIHGLRLSQKDNPIRNVHELACQRARLLGEPEPSLWQVRKLCEEIPAEVKAIADGRTNKFRNKYRYTYRRHFDGSCIIYQIDATPVDVVVKDNRTRGQTKSKQTRPWLTLCIESSARMIMAATFSYDPPNRNTIAATIRDALLITEEKPFGGIPDQIWVDRGKAMIAKHIYTLTKDQGIELHDCITPEEKGRVERFFGTLNTRLWSTLAGYVSSNVKDRNPQAKAEYTITELATRFWRFIDQYHREPHSETQLSPREAWEKQCFALPADPRDLDVLLATREERVLSKEGIQFAGRCYWHVELMDHFYIEDVVIIRAAPDSIKPDTIEVYNQDDEWVCTAFARDSQYGQEVGASDVLLAQRLQRRKIREFIEKARSSLKEADRQCASHSEETTNMHSSPVEEPVASILQQDEEAATKNGEGNALPPSSEEGLPAQLSDQKDQENIQPPANAPLAAPEKPSVVPRQSSHRQKTRLSHQTSALAALTLAMKQKNNAQGEV